MGRAHCKFTWHFSGGGGGDSRGTKVGRLGVVETLCSGRHSTTMPVVCVCVYVRQGQGTHSYKKQLKTAVVSLLE